jgi:hypothetical protein
MREQNYASKRLKFDLGSVTLQNVRSYQLLFSTKVRRWSWEKIVLCPDKKPAVRLVELCLDKGLYFGKKLQFRRKSKAEESPNFILEFSYPSS